MLYDYGSRDPDFGRMVEDIKLRLLRVAGVNPRDYAAVIVQGSGSFGVEATLGTAFPKGNVGNKGVMVAANGAYGERMIKMCGYMSIKHTILRYADNEIVTPDGVKQALIANPHISHLAVVHSETTSGLLNPIADIAAAAREVNPDISLIVDMVSCFGAIPLDLVQHHIDYIISSSNKMIQGVPGFAFVIAKLGKLQQCKGNARSLSLDLFDQWDYQLNNPGQFRFTPPTHVLSAFYQALLEHEKEGGVQARAARYYANQQLLSTEMQKLGFQLYIQPQYQGCVITTFLEPKHPNYDFKRMYDFLARN
jgi:2-aminoethylphosphonate-pyruvate transaminase